MEERDILDMKGACKLLGLSKVTVLKLLREGGLPGRKAGRKWLFSRRQLIAWVEKGKGRRR